nr:DUF362 domain-containing protein [Candidatus Freyarchaeota archaeon]
MADYSAYVSKITDQREDLLRSFEFIDWRKQIKKDSTVFVKPNFTFPYYEKGVTTNPELLKKLLEIIKNRACDVILGESDGGNRTFPAEIAFKNHNMYEICKEAGADLVNLSKLSSVFIETKIQGKRVKVQLSRFLLERVDCIISVPVLKVHVMTGVSLSIKNLWGCWPDTLRALHHKNLNHKLALITKLLKPKIAVIDGIYSLNNHGPVYGKAKKTNIIISSNNPVVADSLGANIIGIPVEKAKHILIAEKEELGTTNLSEVKINDDWKKFKMQFYVKKTLTDKLLTLPFASETLAKIVMDSPFTPFIYEAAEFLRTPEDKEAVHKMRLYV